MVLPGSCSSGRFWQKVWLGVVTQTTVDKVDTDVDYYDCVTSTCIHASKMLSCLLALGVLPINALIRNVVLLVMSDVLIRQDIADSLYILLFFCVWYVNLYLRYQMFTYGIYRSSMHGRHSMLM